MNTYDIIVNDIEIDNPLLINQYYIDKISTINTYYLLIYLGKNKINDSIFKLKINKQVYENIENQLILYKIKNNNNLSKYKLLMLPKDKILKLNKFNYELEENNYIIPIFEIEFKNIMIYLKQFKDNNLDELFKLIVLNDYLKNNYDLKNKILNLNVINKNLNVIINLNNFFIERNTNIKKKIDTNINYMNFKYKYNNPFDNINNRINFINDNNYSKDEINSLFDLLKDNKKQLYYLFFKLLNSQYYHLVLKNKYIFKNYKHIINYHLFCVSLKYIWNIEYFIETNKNINYTKEDAFTIDEASFLPVYPLIKENPVLNPYMSLFMSMDILQPKNNILTFENYRINIFEKKKYNSFVFNGICNLEEFKYRLNIFITKNSIYNIFININFKELKIAITGSIMTACLQRYHPLMSLFTQYSIEEEQFNRYFNEYYALSDIDIMFYAENTFDYIKNVYKFYNILSKNICNLYKDANKTEIKLSFEKNILLFITKEDIKNLSIFDKNLNDEKNLKLFEPLFIQLLQEYKNDIMLKYSNEIDNIPEYFNFDNLKYQIRLTNNKKHIKINYKYKINSVYLYHTFELFMVNKGQDFFATVHSFHLPCVRSYYDGDNVYLTPSCITSHLTGMNIDFKYTASQIEPIDIINKYRCRGFGTYLNAKEKNEYLIKTKSNNYWNNLYDNKRLTSLYFNDKIFKPRMYNMDYYNDVIPVDLEKGYQEIQISEHIIIKNLENFIDEINNKFKNSKKNTDLLMYIYKLNNNNIFYYPISNYIIEAIYK